MIINPYKHIELEVISKDKGEVTFIIKDQTHRGSEFSEIDYDVETKEELLEHDFEEDFSYEVFASLTHPGWCLASRSFPEARIDMNTFYCRGDERDQDANRLQTTLVTFNIIKDMVNEYNNYFSGAVAQDGDTIYISSRRNNVLNKKFNKNENYKLAATEINDLI
jgi:hypothetical protein